MPARILLQHTHHRSVNGHKSFALQTIKDELPSLYYIWEYKSKKIRQEEMDTQLTVIDAGASVHQNLGRAQEKMPPMMEVADFLPIGLF